MLSLAAIAPVALTLPAVANPTNTIDAAELSPRFYINHSEGSGYEGLTSVETFYPLSQTPGQDIWSIFGQLNASNEGEFGGGLQASYRQMLGENMIWGVYGGVDVRDTGSHLFTQTGFGYELIGETWDIHTSANIPFGNTRSGGSSVGEPTITSVQFRGDELILQGTGGALVESALTTVSVDAGMRLFDFGDQLLWGRGGIYYLGAGASEEGLGFRLGLDHRVQDIFRLGLGVQNDPVFDTNVVLSVSALLDPSAWQDYSADAESSEQPAGLWARAAEPLVRTNTILVEEQIEAGGPEGEVAAVNPDSGQAYVINHVDPNAGTSTGTGDADDPIDTIANAVGVTTANADNIIYVSDAGNAGGGFTLPEGTQLRTAAQAQLIETQFGTVQLPGSDTGFYPVVSGTVTVGSNSLISGLAIQPGNGNNAIEASGENITFDRNIISNARRGISLSNIGGTIDITRNTVADTNRAGIFFDDIDGSDSPTVTISDNRIDDTGGRGIRFGDIRDNATVNIQVSDNRLIDIDGGGIRIGSIQDNATANITISNNQVTTTDGNGIQLAGLSESASVELTVSGNTVNPNRTGIQISPVGGSSSLTADINNNTINTPGRDGVLISDQSDQNICLNLNNNTVINAGRDDYRLLTNGTAQFQIVNLANITSLNVGDFNPTNIETNPSFSTGTSGVVPCS